METTVGRFHLQYEQPQTAKFAAPLLILPDLFNTRRHMAVMIGYFASIGWEVYALSLDELASSAAMSPDQLDWPAALALVQELVAALGRGTIVLGHGAGGLLALALAGRLGIESAVALAPLVPGDRSPMLKRASGWLGLSRPRLLYPPRGRTLFELFADAEPFHRDTLIRDLVPASAQLARDIASGKPSLDAAGRAPRLIITGGADPFASAGSVRAMAERIASRIIVVPGRGHWLAGGRTLERVIAEVQRFLVLTLGRDLLLLYPDEP
ncbi:MAG: alpha/beta fold hydrolase [Candidatus Binataceae bacterium]